MIEAGAAGVHFEDQLASEKKCGHLGGKVLVPTRAVRPDAQRRAARGRRAAACRPCSWRAPTRCRATLLTSDVDGVRPRLRDGRAHGRRASSASATGSTPAIARGLAYAPYADLVWFETSTPDLGEARRVRARRSTSASRASCSPTTARRRSTGGKHLDDAQIASLPGASSATGLPVPVRHAGRLPRRSTRRCSSSPAAMPRSRCLRIRASCSSTSSSSRSSATPATRHQHEVGAGYFRPRHAGGRARQRDARAQGSTEEAQFTKEPA